MENFRLKELRSDKKCTQQEISNKTEISRSVISEYESGKSEPTASVLVKLANFFDVSTDYLLGRTDELGGTVLPSPAPELPQDEQQLLALFRKMTHSQKIRFIAYGEGITGASSTSILA